MENVDRKLIAMVAELAAMESTGEGAERVKKAMGLITRTCWVNRYRGHCSGCTNTGKTIARIAAAEVRKSFLYSALRTSEDRRTADIMLSFVRGSLPLNIFSDEHTAIENTIAQVRSNDIRQCLYGLFCRYMADAETERKGNG